MSEKLKPCPFCGGSDLAVQHTILDRAIAAEHMVWCKTCLCRTRKSVSEENAVAIWNRRLGVPAATPEWAGALKRKNETELDFRRVVVQALDYMLMLCPVPFGERWSNQMDGLRHDIGELMARLEP